MVTPRVSEGTKERLLSAEDLLRRYSRGLRGELIRGVFCETMAAGQEHGEIVINLGTALANFVKPRRLGRLMASDTGIRLERDPDTVREPDIAFISAVKLPLSVRNRGYSDTVPDLVVEIVSPEDRLSVVNDKALMWRRYGVRLVWVVDPDKRTIEVHRDSGVMITLTEDDTLDGDVVLPGFRCAVRTVFDL